MKKIIFGLIFALIIVTSISLVSASDVVEIGSDDNIAFNDNPIHCPYGANRTFGDISNKDISINAPNSNHTDNNTNGGALSFENRNLVFNDTFTDNHAPKDSGRFIWEEN